MKIIVITTGGTIAKTFDEAEGLLHNERPVVETIIKELRLPDLTISYRHILYKDSLHMTDADRQLILATVKEAMTSCNAIVIAHGTDTLAVTGEMLNRELPNPPVPVILTGAMRPYEFKDSDALQNVTEALLACRFASPGVHVAMHNRLLKFPGVVKDRQALNFVKVE